MAEFKIEKDKTKQNKTWKAHLQHEYEGEDDRHGGKRERRLIPYIPLEERRFMCQFRSHMHKKKKKKGIDVSLYLDRKQHRLCQHQHGDAPFEEGMLSDVVHLGPETSVFWEADTRSDLDPLLYSLIPVHV